VKLTGKPAEELMVLYVGTATYDEATAKEKQTQVLASMGVKITE
jgi:hypothetical protein